MIKQTIDRIGFSFTESSAFVPAHLDPEVRKEVMQQVFSEDGANFSLTRTHIGACDFCVEGKYSYLDKEGDVALESFSLDPDQSGFSDALHACATLNNSNILSVQLLNTTKNKMTYKLHII